MQEIFYLQVLTTKTENGNASNIWMICICGKQQTECCSVLPGSAASTCVIEKLDSIDIFEKPLFVITIDRVQVDLINIPTRLISLEQLAGEPLVTICHCITQFIPHCLFDHIQVPVFAKYCRNK